jgi:hypothetical protein
VTVRLPLDCERVRPGKKSARESAGVMSYLPAKMAPSSRQNDQDISVNQDLPTNMQDLPVKKSA